jgi:hypothetical protein
MIANEDLTVATFTMQVTKQMFTTYEITADTDDVAVVEKLEIEKLRSFEYEESLKLDWDDSATMPDIVSVELIPPDEEE